ncbi:Adenylyltransferase uba4 [Rhizodiscina lignyota]|uniref:Adenylyltransferase and sulfurtransferase uba4 n=1 Tax=Rhizodiscina lignyota TaxID=1504668 RepID=A0A9P4IGF4_9PEZI|nr:Adenylyltransferase uba4 [Rhizodiscina lignyota]
MADIDNLVENLRREISICEDQLKSLKAQLAATESRKPPTKNGELPHSPESAPESADSKVSQWPLLSEEYERYGRQLIMPEVGLKGQLHLKGSSILIIGIGGLGCPAVAYLAGAGVGTIGLCDGDYVERSNLHRQILHNTYKIGISKVDSAIDYLKALNPNVTYCTDTPASRYLISDTCVLLGKPLVSASALQTNGQLNVFNFPARPVGDLTGGPCYRCMFPKPPPPESVLTCGEGGILGPVVGVMGVLQALEAIKLIASGNIHCRLTDQGYSDGERVSDDSQAPQGLIFSAYSSTPFRSFKMRRRRGNCAACSSHAIITRESLRSGSMDYAQFCGAISPISALSTDERVSAEEYAAIERSKGVNLSRNKSSGYGHILIDTRDKVQFELCSLKDSINVPYAEISASDASPHGVEELEEQEEHEKEADWLQMIRKMPSDAPIYVVCRLGNDSQLAVRKLKELGLDESGTRQIRDIKGGLKAWRDKVDHNFPNY